MHGLQRHAKALLPSAGLEPKAKLAQPTLSWCTVTRYSMAVREHASATAPGHTATITQAKLVLCCSSAKLDRTRSAKKYMKYYILLSFGVYKFWRLSSQLA